MTKIRAFRCENHTICSKMEQVMLSKIMVSIARYNAVADTCASSDQHAQGLMSCCSILTICIELGSSSIILTSRCGNVAVHLLFFAQSSSRVQVSNQWCRQASLSPYMIYLTSNMLEELSKNCCVALEGANAICFCDLLQTVVGNL